MGEPRERRQRTENSPKILPIERYNFLSVLQPMGLRRDLTGESKTEPTELILVLSRNSCPICCMISVGPSIHVLCVTCVATFVRHADLSCFTDDFGDILSLFNRRRDQFFELGQNEDKRVKEREALTRDIFTDCESA